MKESPLFEVTASTQQIDSPDLHPRTACLLESTLDAVNRPLRLPGMLLHIPNGPSTDLNGRWRGIWRAVIVVHDGFGRI
jgi:hypothetical protein